MCKSRLLCHSARSARPFPAALTHRLPGSSGVRPPLTCRPCSRRLSSDPWPPLRTDLVWCPGPGCRTYRGHGEPSRQIPAELLAPGPRAGRARPRVLLLSAGGLCIRVPGPHHAPLGPGQVSAASPAAPWRCCKLPSACGKIVTLSGSVLFSPFLLGLHSGLRGLPILRAYGWMRRVRNPYDLGERAPDWGNEQTYVHVLTTTREWVTLTELLTFWGLSFWTVICHVS